MKIGVVAHIARVRLADKLVRNVRADVICLDKGMVGPQANHLRVWRKLQRITAAGEWAVVLEDDAQPCNNFRAQAQAALDSIPQARIASFYLGKLRPTHYQDRVGQAVAAAERDDASWIVGDAVLHGVAIALRGETIGSMIAEVEKSGRPIDDSITYWARKRYTECWNCWPSIVQHRDVPTIIQDRTDGAREPGRVAWQFGTRDIWTHRSVML